MRDIKRAIMRILNCKQIVEISLLIGITVTLGGCAAPQYHPDSEQPISGMENREMESGYAVVEFTTNTLESAYFLQTHGDDLCKPDSSDKLAIVARKRIVPEYEKGIRSAGAILSLGLSTLLESQRIEKPHLTITKQKSGKPLNIRSSSYINYGNSRISCGPLFLSFIPEEMKRYQVKFIREGKFCTVSLTENSDDSIEKPVNHSRWSCSESFWGIGGGKVLGFREFKPDP